MRVVALPTNYEYRGEKYSVELLREAGPDREVIERKLIDSGVHLPLPHRCAWAKADTATTSWFLAVRDPRGRYCCGFAIEVGRSRALPGHHILRVERFGAASSDEAREVGLRALADVARREPRILRIELDVFSRHSDIRSKVAALVTPLGFRRPEAHRAYTRTLVVDLGREEGDVFSSFSSTARQNIRAVQKGAWRTRCITEARCAEDIEALLSEAFRRTGGQHPQWDWSSIIDLSTKEPTLSRLIGLFAVEDGGRETLRAFAWGRSHGDHAEYGEAGSARVPGTRTPLSHALAWDLMCWARRNGATWFDLGGITERDALAGISHFKRFFSKEVADVREEWALEPRYLRGRVAHAVSTTGGWLATAMRRARTRRDGKA